MEVVSALGRVRGVLDERGILIRQDAKLPSATTLIVEEPIGGSWWSHPKNKLVYDVFGLLDDDVAWVKLLCGKVTLVHKRLWPALVSIAMSREDWQMSGLSSAGQRALTAIDRVVRSDELTAVATGRALRELVSDMERRLLVYAEDEHTERGNHSRVLMPWSAWCQKKGIAKAKLPPPGAARSAFEAAIAGWPGAWLPWSRAATQSASR